MLHLTIPVPGKFKSRHSLVAMSARAVNKLVVIEDAISNRLNLVDSGVQRSILPASAAHFLANWHGAQLDAANGTSIRTMVLGMRLCVSMDVVVFLLGLSLLVSDLGCIHSGLHTQ